MPMVGGGASVTRLAIDIALNAMLEPSYRRLGEAGQGAWAVTLRAFRVDRDVQEITSGTGLPTRVPGHLRRLFANELDRLEPDVGFERMTLEVRITNDMVAAQDAVMVVNCAQVERFMAQFLDAD